jgi:D-sedoheptulose 7-phosphate isomerase
LGASRNLLKKSATALHGGGKFVFFGNGGSTDRRGLAALALTANPSVLTAAGNDYGFERIFSRQIESLVAPQDVLVALSTSGTSPNIVGGVEAGRARGAYLVAFTGETGGALAKRVDLLLNVPSQDPQRIQEAHITIGHIVCALIERMATT